MRHFASHFNHEDETVVLEETTGWLARPDDHIEGVVLHFHLNDDTGRRENLEFIARRLRTSYGAWFTVRANAWYVDLDKLRGSLGLDDLSWLTGTAVVAAEYDVEVKEMWGGDKRTAHFRIILTQDTLEQILETDEQRRTRTFDERHFHAEIVASCRGLFVGGHIDQAVNAGCLRIGVIVQTRLNFHKDGDTLFAAAFKQDGALKFNSLARDDEKNEQRGFMLLFQGMWGAIRNPLSHRVVGLDELRGLEHLAFLSMLLRYYDTATPNP